MFMLSEDQVRAIYGAHQDIVVQSLLADGQALLSRYGISDSRRRLAYFLAQTAHEVGSGGDFKENLNYSSTKRLIEVWPSRFNAGNAAAYVHNPEGLANHVYSNRMGNGDEASGDGWRYRGRGLIQITGKNNYRAVGEAAGLDLIGNPDLAADPRYLLLCAAAYWKINNLNHRADQGDFDGLSEAINPGSGTGVARRERLRRVEQALDTGSAGGFGPKEPGNPGTTTSGKNGRSDMMMQYGDEGDKVKALQEQLNKLRYYVGAADRKFGKRTRDGVVAFQMDHGLEPTGIVNAALMAMISVASPRDVVNARRDKTVGDLRKDGSSTIRNLDGASLAALITALLAALGFGKDQLMSMVDALQSSAQVDPRVSGLFSTVQSFCTQPPVKGTTLPAFCSKIGDVSQILAPPSLSSDPTGLLQLIPTVLNAIIPGSGLITNIALGLGGVIFARRAMKARVKDHNSGAHLGR